MASGRARLPPTPQANGAGSSGSSSRPLAEMHTSNNNTTYGSHVAGLDMSAASTGSVQDMQMLENLTDQERQIILNVLNRDENVRQADAARIMLLRAELFNLRKAKGNVKALVAGGGSLDRPTYIESTRSCSRCGTELGRIINRGAPCRSCRLRVCKGCREFSTRTTDWVCVVCHKQIELQAASEDWMSEYTDGTTTTTTTATAADIRRTSQVIAGSRTTVNSSTSIASTGDYLPVAATELIKKSIRRSWTISNAEDENRQCGGGGGGADPQQYSHLPRKQSQSSYPSLVRYPYINPCTMAEYSQEDDFDNELHPPMGRRMPPRQSTLPNPDAGMFYGSNNNLMPPSLSPNKGLSPSPQYSPYHTDNENDDDPQQQTTSPIGARYKIRRQSTLPCRPNEANHEIGTKLMSTSPNSRTNLYQPSTMTPTGRSPDKSELAGDQPSPRYPPFVRQSTFPSNSSDPFFLQIQAHSQQQPLPQQPGQQRHLPTSPNRMLFNKSPDQAADQESADVATTRPANRFQMTRQATLPNPDQHVKLLPTSPPKKQQQLSPHSIKRSPEFARQNTLPAPDSMNSLSVHQHGPKFMPISPRQKQSFLFPQSAQPAPRPFLSQQHFPTMLADEGQAAVTPGSVSIGGGAGAGVGTGGIVGGSALVGASGGPPGTAAAHHHSAKMIKVRSHSNEEYSLNRTLTVEGRRLLPEIPANRSPRLVRQEHVREPCYDTSAANPDKRSPKQKTFAEAKQAMMDEYGGGGIGGDSAATSSTTINNDSTAAHFDEDEEASYYINEESYDSSYDRLRLRASMAPVSTIKSAESFLNDADYPSCSGASSGYPVDPKTENRRLRRRKSRDLPVEPEAVASSNEDEPIKQHRKPETMRSISEDSPGNKTVKMTPRRSLSHPEKDTQQMQNTRKTEITKIPSPRPLAEILERAQRSIKLPSPRRKAFKSMDQACESDMAANGSMTLPATAMSQSPSLATTATPGGSTGAIARTGPRKISAFQQILQNQRLQKRDSKSLDVVASKLMEEKYGGYPEADEDKSKSLDDGIFCGDKNSDDNSSDEQINLIDKKQHKTYLGEDEIQHAVEAAAVLFKKVVLQRREEKRTKDEEEASGTLEAGSSPVIGSGDRNGATGGSNQELSTAAAAAVAGGGSSGTGTGPHRSVATSPIGSTGSEHWPSQSDEDIDRLVALHQNRASLSSLGLRSDSMASVYSGAGEGRYGTVTVRGQIEFGMQYNYKQGALEIHVKQCRDLAAVDAKRNRSDPYVKVYLLPDKSKGGKRKTKVKKHTLNPVFDEVLRFHISLAGLQSRTVWMTVWHSDMFGRNDFLGEVMMGLQDKMFDNPAPQWYQLQERSEPFEDLSAYKGDIIVGLKYIPPESDGGTPQHHASHHNGSGSSGSGGGPTGTLNLRKFSTRSITSTSSNSSGQSRGALHVLVKEAKNLQPVKANGTCDAFCKSYLLPDKNRSSKQKTPVVKRSNSPVWNYTFIYEDISLAELSERGLELTIWDHDRLASNEFLGGVRFSLGTGKHGGRTVDWMDSTGRELSLWQNMINRPNFWVEGALVLRPSLDNAKFTS